MKFGWQAKTAERRTPVNLHFALSPLTLGSITFRSFFILSQYVFYLNVRFQLLMKPIFSVLYRLSADLLNCDFSLFYFRRNNRLKLLLLFLDVDTTGIKNVERGHFWIFWKINLKFELWKGVYLYFRTTNCFSIANFT